HLTVRKLLSNVTLQVSDSTGDIDTHIQLIKFVMGSSMDMVSLVGMTLIPLVNRPEFAKLELVVDSKASEWIYTATETEQQLIPSANIVHPIAGNIMKDITTRNGTELVGGFLPNLKLSSPDLRLKQTKLS